MTTFYVQPGGNPTLGLYSPRHGVRIRFEDGSYQTDDEREIAALRESPLVFDADDLLELSQPSPFDDGDADPAEVDAELERLKLATGGPVQSSGVTVHGPEYVVPMASRAPVDFPPHGEDEGDASDGAPE